MCKPLSPISACYVGIANVPLQEQTLFISTGGTEQRKHLPRGLILPWGSHPHRARSPTLAAPPAFHCPEPHAHEGRPGTFSPALLATEGCLRQPRRGDKGRAGASRPEGARAAGRGHGACRRRRRQGGSEGGPGAGRCGPGEPRPAQERPGPASPAVRRGPGGGERGEEARFPLPWPWRCSAGPASG